MITFNTKKESSKFLKEWQSYLDNEFNPILYAQYVKLNKGPEYDCSELSTEEMDILINTPATQEPFENILHERLNEVALEMFLLSNPK